jgi:hypothetical protein
MGVKEIIPSIEDTKAQAIGFAANKAPSWAHGDYNFVGKWARALAQLFSGFFRALLQADADAIPSKDSSTAALDRHGDVFGLPSGSATTYGRHIPIAATGITGIITGTSGTTVVAGSTLIGPDGVTQFSLRNTITLPGIAPGTSQKDAFFDAITPGTAGNLSQNARMTWSPTLAGIDATVTVQTGTDTGRDAEDDGSLYDRIRQRLQLPPKGGAPQDYGHGAEAWCENATDGSGNPITNIRAFGYSGGYDGTGGVMVVITINGSGLARIPTLQNLTDIQEFVRGDTSNAGKSPICASFRCIAPYMDPDETGLVLVCRVIPSLPSLAFDWHRGTTDYEVFSWDGASKLTLTGLAPSDLKLAIDNAQKPRIYVDCRTAGVPRGPVIPPMVRCVAYADAAGRTTLTLELPLAPGFLTSPPAAGDKVYAGQATICDAEAGVPAAILAYVDELGSSRVSGMHDPGDIWDDVAAISGVQTAAINTLMADGLTPMLARCVANETKIGVGVNTPTEQDVQAPDNATYGPGLWYATRILVTDY